MVGVGGDVSHVEVGDTALITWLPRSAERARVPIPSKVPLADGTWARTHNVFTWATHALADEQYVVKAPQGTPGDVGAIIGCAVMTGAGAVLNRAVVRAGQSVAVWGVGGIGLSAVAAARNAGAATVIAVDVDEDKLELARRLGADHLVNSRASEPVARVRELARARLGVEGVDIALDCTGRPECVRQVLAAVRPGVPAGRNGRRRDPRRGATNAVRARRHGSPLEREAADRLLWRRLHSGAGLSDVRGVVPQRDPRSQRPRHRSLPP